MSIIPEKLKVDIVVSDMRRSCEGVIVPQLCHGDRIVLIDTGTEAVTQCDALITKNHHVQLGVTTADCAPICFGDGKNIGIAHAGWRGLCLGLIEKMLKHFDHDTLEVFVGPHLNTFEVQKDFCYDAIVKKFGENFFTIEDTKIIFHFKDAIQSCFSIPIVFDPRSTGTDLTLPSYRRNKTSERILTIVQCNNQHETT